MKKSGFLIRFLIFSIIIWILVWSGSKVWGYHSGSEESSGFPFEYSKQVECDYGECPVEFNVLNLFLDILICLAVSFFITLLSYKVRGSVY